MLSMEGLVGARLLGEESLQMWDLNKRLEAYLARVKFLEEENEGLRAQIRGAKSGPAAEPWRAKYEEELRALRAALDRAFREKCSAELARDNLYEEVQHVRSRCQKEKEARDEAKRQLAAGKKELEEERRAQIWLKERAAQLEKEVGALLEVHEEEKAGLDRELAGFSQSLESLRCAPAAFQPLEVEDYSRRLAEIWRGAVETYKAEVAQLERSLGQAKESLWKVAEDGQQSQMQLQHLDKELAALRARKELLEDNLARQWQEQRGEAEKFQVGRRREGPGGDGEEGEGGEDPQNGWRGAARSPPGWVFVAGVLPVLGRKKFVRLQHSCETHRGKGGCGGGTGLEMPGMAPGWWLELQPPRGAGSPLCSRVGIGKGVSVAAHPPQGRILPTPASPGPEPPFQPLHPSSSSCCPLEFLPGSFPRPPLPSPNPPGKKNDPPCDPLRGAGHPGVETGVTPWGAGFGDGPGDPLRAMAPAAGGSRSQIPASPPPHPPEGAGAIISPHFPREPRGQGREEERRWMGGGLANTTRGWSPRCRRSSWPHVGRCVFGGGSRWRRPRPPACPRSWPSRFWSRRSRACGRRSPRSWRTGSS